MEAFIVRPFGTREGIDFDKVDKLLITPALKQAGLKGGTTGLIFEAGNIRTDMFELLLTSEVVVADISINNANVYYELGIRHALRDRVTVMIYSDAKVHEIPFDLKTDRYLAYDAKEPAAAVDSLCKAIEDSLAGRRADSPVFALLPLLKPADAEVFRPVPLGFTDEVRAAADLPDLPKLAVLADEAREMSWSLAGLRVVGEAQFRLEAWDDALATFEAIRDLGDDDAEANLKLGTVLERLGRLPESSAALDRVMRREGVSRRARAEADALIGRNAKTLWREEWIELPKERRQAAALESGWFEQTRSAYDTGFLDDQNHWYPGINALSMLTIRLRLAAAEPDVWNGLFTTDDLAMDELERLRSEHVTLAAAVTRSIQASRHQEPAHDIWREFTAAELIVVTQERPSAAAGAYRRAATGAAPFELASAAKQLQLFLDLGVLVDNATAALKALAPPPPDQAKPEKVVARAIVFSGHRIDAPGREHPRFPAAAEAKATAMIRAEIENAKRLAGDSPITGIAGGASGGDIIFHEQCAELGIPTELLLALPQDDFCAASVSDAGPDWVERFRLLAKRVTTKVLADSDRLPDWLAKRDDYSIWQRNNRWILHSATSRADTDVTLIVLWDGKGGDGPGGTEDMVGLGKRRGVKVVLLDAKQLVEPE